MMRIESIKSDFIRKHEDKSNVKNFRHELKEVYFLNYLGLLVYDTRGISIRCLWAKCCFSF